MPDPIQETIDKYLRGETSLEEGLTALQAYMNSTSGLSMSMAGMSPEQRKRLEALVRRFNEVRSKEVARLLAEAREAGREVAEIHFRDDRPGEAMPQKDQ